MDKITHEVCFVTWKNTFEQCNGRHRECRSSLGLKNSINKKTYYYWLRCVRCEMYARMNMELAVAKVQPEDSAVVLAEIFIIEQTSQTVGTFL